MQIQTLQKPYTGCLLFGLLPLVYTLAYVAARVAHVLVWNGVRVQTPMFRDTVTHKLVWLLFLPLTWLEAAMR